VGIAGLSRELVADPIRPLAYVHTGGAAVSIFNVSTGASVPVISGSPPQVPNYSWVAYSTTTGQLLKVLEQLQAYPGNVEVGWDGHVYCGLRHHHARRLHLDADWTSLGTVRVAVTGNMSLADHQLVVAGDGLRLLGITTDFTTGELRFVTAP
jgi:hypothetical protein